MSEFENKLHLVVHKYLYEQSFDYPVDSSTIRWNMQECAKDVMQLIREQLPEKKPLAGLKGKNYIGLRDLGEITSDEEHQRFGYNMAIEDIKERLGL